MTIVLSPSSATECSEEFNYNYGAIENKYYIENIPIINYL